MRSNEGHGNGEAGGTLAASICKCVSFLFLVSILVDGA